jgi:DNA-directed RNA polymerase subunit RPC12/RpoP
MDNLLILTPFLAALAFVLFHALRRVRCPDCGDPLPVLYSPFRKTRRMWRRGGYLCARCGCETDLAGRKVTADTAVPPSAPAQWALAAGLFLAGLGLLAGFKVAVSTAAAAPPVITAPQQVPPAAPGN